MSLILVLSTSSLVYADSQDGDWFLREHCRHAFCTLTNNAGTNYYTHEYKLDIDPASIGGFDGVVQIQGFGGSPRFTDGNLGKVFDKDELDGKLITWEVQGHTLNSVDPNMILYDGELDPFILSFNGSGVASPNPNIFPCGVDCFSDSAGVITSGSGSAITVINPSIPNDDRNLIQNFTGSANLSSFDSPTGKVTLVISQGDANQSTFMGSRHFQVTIEDLGTYRFKSDTNDNQWNGTTITCSGVNSCTTQNINQKEESVWSVTSRVPDFIQPVITTSVSEPIPIMLDKAFDEFAFVSCNDNTDGDITNSMITVGTVDTSDRGSYTVEYTCIDNQPASNSNTQEIQYVVQKPSTGITSGTTSGDSQGSGGTTSVETLDDVPATTEDIQESIPLLQFGDNGVETEGQSIGDLFANLFDNRITQGISTPAPSVSSGSPTPTQTSNPVTNFFTNFFTNLFGGFVIPMAFADSSDGDWFGAEHGGDDNNSFSYRVEFRKFGSTAIDGVKMGSATFSSTQTNGYLFKVFDKAELDGKLITVELNHDFTVTGKAELQLYDGEFDPVPTEDCGTDCFPFTFKPETLAIPIVTSGSGGFLTLLSSQCSITGCTTQVRFLSGSADLSSFDSPTGKVTLMMKQLEISPSASGSTNIYSIEIEDTGFYNLRNDPQDPTWNGAVVSCKRECNVSSSNPSTYFTITSNPPDLIEPVITTTASEPIPIMLDKAFDPLQYVSCNDNKDGDITNSMITVGTVDTSDRGSYTVEYTCTDVAPRLNSDTQEIQYVVQKPSTGITSGTTSGDSQGSGGTTDVETLDDVPATTEDIQAPIPLLQFGDDGVETEGQSIGDLFANLFDNRITQGISTPAPSVSSSPTPTPTSNPVTNFFQSFFANLFG